MHIVLFLDIPSGHVVQFVKETTEAAIEKNVKPIAVVHPNNEEKNNGKPKNPFTVLYTIIQSAMSCSIYKKY